MRAWTLALLAALALTAGCLGSDADDEDDDEPPEVSPDWYANAVPFEGDHDHTDTTHHQGLTTPNFETIGYNPLETEYHGATSGDYFCGETATDGERDIAVMHSFGTDVALLVVDVSDPNNPTLLSEIALPYAHVYDTAVTPDGAYAALGISEIGATTPDEDPAPLKANPNDPFAHASPNDPEPIQAHVTNRCQGTPTTTLQETDETPYGSGTLLVSLEDPEEPTVEDWYPQPVVGPHSIHAQHVDGEPVILASITNLAHETAYFDFLTIQETPTGPMLTQQDRYATPYPDQGVEGAPSLVNGHVDGWIEQHPTEDTYLAYLANWDGGFHVLEHDETLGTWTPIAIWNDYDPDAGSGMTGQIHTAFPMPELDEDGNHYTWIGQEVVTRPADRPTGNIIKMDTTDPANPEPVARWTLPTDLEFDASLEFSTHYVRVVDDTLFISLYHGGVWAAGTTPIEGTHELPTHGVFIPDSQAPNPPNTDYLLMDHAPVVLDVMTLPSGELVIFDGASGVYTVQYDPTVPTPQPDPWEGDDWTPDQGTLQPVP